MAHHLPSSHSTAMNNQDGRRGSCMNGPGGVGESRWSYLAPETSDGKVLYGHKPQSKPHLSEPGTHQRTWRVMGRPARQKTQTLSMTRRSDRPRHVHAAAPSAVRPSHHPQKKEPPGTHPGNSLNHSNSIIQPEAETSESPSHWKPSRSPLQDSSASLQSSHIHAEYKQYHQQP